jgi:hypothetical protein
LWRLGSHATGPATVGCLALVMARVIVGWDMLTVGVGGVLMLGGVRCCGCSVPRLFDRGGLSAGDGVSHAWKSTCGWGSHHKSLICMKALVADLLARYAPTRPGNTGVTVSSPAGVSPTKLHKERDV